LKTTILGSFCHLTRLNGESALRNIITRWRRDGWIEKTDSKHWHKVKVEN